MKMNNIFKRLFTTATTATSATVAVALPCLLALVLSIIVVMPIDKVEAGTTSNPRIIDQADYLNSADEAELDARLREISNRYNIDLVFVSVKSVPAEYYQAYGDDAPMYYADDIVDFGFDNNQPYSDNNFIFLLSDEYREWTLTGEGYGIYAFTDKGREYIFEAMRSQLADDDFAGAVSTFADKCELFLIQADNGKPYDVGNMPKEPFNFGLWVLIALGVGAVVGFVVGGVNRAQLKSVAVKTEASDYIRPGSFNLTRSRDIYMYRRVTRVRHESSSGGGGGSTTHHSAGGTHSGSHGHF